MAVSSAQKAVHQFHRSLKWLYQMLMALALYTGAGTYVASVRERIIEHPEDLAPVLISFDTLVFLCFTLALVRFLVGDNRYLDLLYLEAYPAAFNDPTRSFSGRRRFADIWLLLIHGLLFYVLGVFLDQVVLFLQFYALLMLFNVVWLAVHLLLHWLNRAGFLLEEKLDEALPLKPLKVWASNNFLTALAILTMVHYWQSEQRILIAVLVVLVNSLVDFWLAWSFYFPELGQLASRATPGDAASTSDLNEMATNPKESTV